MHVILQVLVKWPSLSHTYTHTQTLSLSPLRAYVCVNACMRALIMRARMHAYTLVFVSLSVCVGGGGREDT